MPAVAKLNICHRNKIIGGYALRGSKGASGANKCRFVGKIEIIRNPIIYKKQSVVEINHDVFCRRGPKVMPSDAYSYSSGRLPIRPLDPGQKYHISDTYISSKLPGGSILLVRQRFFRRLDRFLGGGRASLGSPNTIDGGPGGDAALSNGDDQRDYLAYQSDELKPPYDQGTERVMRRILRRDSLAALGIICAGMALQAAGWWYGLNRLAGRGRLSYVACACLWASGVSLFGGMLWWVISRA